MPRTSRARELLLETLDLGRAFGPVVALRGLNLKVYGGECVALMGPNGSGKTTAAELISGLLEPSAGWAKVQGYSVHDDPDAIAARARLATAQTSAKPASSKPASASNGRLTKCVRSTLPRQQQP